MGSVIRFLFGFILGFMIMTFILRLARADDVNVYNSPTDKTKRVVEYCFDDKHKDCHILIIDKEDSLEQKEVVAEWFDFILDNYGK